MKFCFWLTSAFFNIFRTEISEGMRQLRDPSMQYLKMTTTKELIRKEGKLQHEGALQLLDKKKRLVHDEQIFQTN